MYERAEILDKLRYLFVGMLIIASVLLLPFMVSALGNTPSSDMSSSALTVSVYDSPNVITGSMGVMADRLNQATATTTTAIGDSAQSVAVTITKAGKLVGSGVVASGKFVANAVVGTGKFVFGTIGSVVSFVAHGVVSGVVFVASIPNNAFGYFAQMPVVRTTLSPADKMPLPTINPNSPAVAASVAAPAVKAAAVTSPQAPQVDTHVVWPIIGDITTRFGVPHWPYQPVHTGLDISDGKPSGVTPVRPFRRGRVTETMYSRYGLGNNVTVDHGGGVVSKYGHLSSIAVQVGQEIDTNATLGYQGSTGASTGPHVHFEVRVNGQLVNPLQYLSGQQ